MSILIVSPQGVVGKKASLAIAATAADAVGQTVVVASPQVITTAIVWPTDRELKFERGGSVTFTGAGALTNLKEVTPQNFGAVGLNFADDTVAFEKAIAAITRPNGSTYARGTLLIPPGQYKVTRVLNIPYGTSVKGSGAMNTIILVDGAGTTDGFSITGDVANFNEGGGISELWITSTAGKSRDLITMSAASNVRLDHLLVTSAGRYGINLMDTVAVRGYGVTVSDSGAAGLYVNTASPASSIATTTDFFGSAFRTTVAGYGAVVNGIGINFHGCFFEYNVGGGISIGSGTVTLTAPYFEGNTVGHNILTASNPDTTLRDSTKLTVINPQMVPNSPVDYYGLYINGGSTTLIGGGYSTTAKTIYINRANYPSVNMLGVSLVTAPTISSGTIGDVSGVIQYSDPSTGTSWQTGGVGTTLTKAGDTNATSSVAVYANMMHVVSTGTINTLTPPFSGFRGSVILIPDSAFTTGTSGNIAIASTAVVGKAMTMTYDGTKWYPSY